MDKPELLAEFRAQLDLFDKYRSFIEKAKSHQERFNPVVVEKVIRDNTDKIQEVADALDPIVGDMKQVIADLEADRQGVHDGVAAARLELEELELRQTIGEIDDEEFESRGADLQAQIGNADADVAGIDAELAQFNEALERWLSERPSGGDDPGGEPEGGSGLDGGDDLLGLDDGFDDAPRGRGEGVHAERVSVKDDVSAVFGGAPADDEPIPAGDGISFSGDELGDLGADALAAAPAAEEATREYSAVLVMQEGTPDEKLFPLTSNIISIGRGRDNTIQVKNDSKVSRYHCKFFRRDDHFFIEDNKSANGTLVDGELVTEKRLLGGEEIIVGETFFRFRVNG